MIPGWALALSIALTALAAAFAGLAALAALARRRPTGTHGLADAPLRTTFVFDGETLVDASPAARSMLAASPIRGAPWQQFMGLLLPRFPDAATRIAHLPDEGRFVLDAPASAHDGRLTLFGEWRGGMARLSLTGPEDDGRFLPVDPMTYRAMTEELVKLRNIVAQAPFPIWTEDGSGATTWGNLDYMLRVERKLADETLPDWPLPALTPAPARNGERVQIDGAGWLETAVHQGEGGRTIYGLPITRLVQAESSLRDFTQTLAKTFAHLPIGLAIFDRQRRLALFNPALPDLTTLPVDFLAARPTLADCLDRMRELRMIPEPRDYHHWRKRMAEIEQEATSGIYDETWYLHGAQTYRVLGRPHPDGALALLIEDITPETTRTRRYRADVELGQSVMDELDEAIAVFSPAGHLVLSNAAYAALWGHDPSGIVGGDSSVLALSAHWRALTAPTKVWAQAESFVATLGERQAWLATARLADGRALTCRFVPLAGGSTLAAFRPNAPRPRRAALPPATARETA
jgi:PAS domain-containing protein